MLEVFGFLQSISILFVNLYKTEESNNQKFYVDFLPSFMYLWLIFIVIIAIELYSFSQINKYTVHKNHRREHAICSSIQ